MRGAQMLVLAGLSLLAGCSLVADFGQYTGRDADTPPDATMSDAGSTCGGIVCASGEACCANTCIPLGTLTDCAECGDTCADGLNSDPVCMDGACEATCDVGFGDCDGNVSNGCEQALNVGDHCGGCGMACDDGDVCATVEGVTSCRSTCPAGEVECGRGCFDLDTSPLNCGECGMRCRIPVGGGLPICVDGECADGCEDGMADCDGDDSDCESVLVTRFDDLDNDDFGDPEAGFLTCPNEPFTADNDLDCDDTVMAVNPDADEICDGVDNNCSGTSDDVPTIDDSCSCVTGSDPGALACGATVGAPVCVYPAMESCNGLDDTCSGTADDDPSFVCALGARQACTLAALPTGCVPQGGQECEATCLGFGACVPTDLCNRMDDDCDDIVDEDALEISASPLSLGAGSDISGLRAHLNPTSGQVGLVYAQGTNVRFMSINPDGSVQAGPIPIPGIIESDRGAGDVTWVGTHWVVGFIGFVTGTQQARVVSIAEDGTLGSPVTLLRGTTDPTAIRLDRIGTSNQALVAWTAESTVGGRNGIYEGVATVTTDGDVSVDDDVLDDSGGTRSWRDVDVVSIEGGALMAFVRQQDTSDARIFVGTSTGGFVGSTSDLILDGRIERDLELAFDRVDGRVGMVYATAPPSGGGAGDLMLASFDADSSGLEVRMLQAVPPARERWSIGVANDGAFGVVYATGSGATFQRFDSEDLQLWTTHAPAPGLDQAIVGLPTSDVHYLLFGNADPGAVVQPVQCL